MSHVIRNEPRAITILFPGQGAQTLGMAGLANEISDRIFRIANKTLGYDLQALIKNGPIETLNKTEFSQPAMFVCSWIAFLNLKAAYPALFANPDIELNFAGLSLGEYTALAAANVISFEDCLWVVSQRAIAMQKAADANDGAMMTVLGLENSQLEQVCTTWTCQENTNNNNKTLQVANYLFPKGQVVSGEKSAMEWVEKQSKQAGATLCRRLPVSGAFHTTHMLSAADMLSNALSQVDISRPTPGCKVYSNVTGEPHTSFHDSDATIDSLCTQLVSSVQWERTLRNVQENWQQDDLIFEVGPGRQISSMLKRFRPSKELVKNFFVVDNLTSLNKLHTSGLLSRDAFGPMHNAENTTAVSPKPLPKRVTMNRQPHFVRAYSRERIPFRDLL